MLELLIAMTVTAIIYAAVVVVIVTTAGTTQTQQTVYQQDGQLRFAAQVVERDLGAALTPLTVAGPAAPNGCASTANLCLDWQNPSSQAANPPYEWGQSLTFYRAETTTAGAPDCIAETIAYAAYGSNVGGVTFKAPSSGTWTGYGVLYEQVASSASGPPSMSTLSSSTSVKVLADHVLAPDLSGTVTPLFGYYQDALHPAKAVSSSDDSWKANVQLVDFTLVRDADGTSPNVAPAEIQTAVLLPKPARNLQSASVCATQQDQ